MSCIRKCRCLKFASDLMDRVKIKARASVQSQRCSENQNCAIILCEQTAVKNTSKQKRIRQQLVFSNSFSDLAKHCCVDSAWASMGIIKELYFGPVVLSLPIYWETQCGCPHLPLCFFWLSSVVVFSFLIQNMRMIKAFYRCAEMRWIGF